MFQASDELLYDMDAAFAWTMSNGRGRVACSLAPLWLHSLRFAASLRALLCVGTSQPDLQVATARPQSSHRAQGCERSGPGECEVMPPSGGRGTQMKRSGRAFVVVVVVGNAVAHVGG